jgi:hypothetical protein
MTTADPLPATCESGLPVEACGARARYRVRRIGRAIDAQDSCGRHLAQTVDALAEGAKTEIVVSTRGYQS